MFFLKVQIVTILLILVSSSLTLLAFVVDASAPIPAAPIYRLKCGVNSDINLPDHRAVLSNNSIRPSTVEFPDGDPFAPCEQIIIGPNVVFGSIDTSSSVEAPVTIVSLALTGVQAQLIDLTGVYFVRSPTTS